MTTSSTQTGYVIVETHQYYGEQDRRWLVKDDRGRAVRFASRADAQQHIDEYLDVGRYYTQHNEVGRPTYTIRAIAALPQYLQWQL